MTDPIIQSFKACKAQRSNWEPLWEELSKLVLPRRDFSTRRAPGAPRTDQIYDSTAVWANETLAAALHTYLTPTNLTWFSLRPIDPSLKDNEAIRLWAMNARDIMLNGVFNSATSGFHTAAHEFYLELPAFGTSHLYIPDTLKFTSMPLGECYIKENNLGIVDTIYREWEWPKLKIIKEYGDDGMLPEQVTKAKDEDKFKLMQYIAPANDIEGVTVKPPKDFVSIHYVLLGEGGGTRIRERGFDSFPIAVGRWAKIPGEEYGRSPAMSVLPDIRMLQEMKRVLIRGAQKGVDPVLLVPDDGMVRPKALGPGDMLPVRRDLLIAGAEPRPLITKGRVDIGMEFLEYTRETVKRAFFLDRLSIRDQFQGNGPEMTATEVLQLREEAFRLMGPTVSRLQVEFLSPIIARVYNILIRDKIIPAPPIKDFPVLEVEFESPAALAQRASESDALVQWLNDLMALAQGSASTEVFKIIDPIKYARWTSSRRNVTPTVLRTDEEIAQVTQQEMAFMAASQMAQANG